MARLSLTVPDEMREWLDEHPEINVSGLLQSAIQKEMKNKSPTPDTSPKTRSPGNKVASNYLCRCGKLFGGNLDTDVDKCPRCGSAISLPHDE